jgi:soluble lytic murein transglycosylase-like protein
VNVPAPRVLVGVAASVLVLGLALAIADADAATPMRPQRTVASAPTPMAKPVGMLIDPYTRAAAACRGLDPMILVAIHDVETNRDARGATSVAGAVGPMQFLPDTWAAYGLDGDGDGAADVWNLNDALAGATHFLCTHGVTLSATRESAIWNYNHSHSYVRRVLDRTLELHGTAS